MVGIDKNVPKSMDKIRAELLCDIATYWNRFTEDEKQVLLGVAGNQPRRRDDTDLFHLAGVIVKFTDLYIEVIPAIIKRYRVDSPSIATEKQARTLRGKGDETMNGTTNKNIDRIFSVLFILVVLFTPLIVRWVRSYTNDQPLREEKNEKAAPTPRKPFEEELKEHRAKRKLVKKEAKAKRVQKYSGRHGKVGEPLKKRLVKGTPEYEKEKARLDAELDDYWANSM